MGIDLIRGGRIASRGFRKTKSSNAYLQSLIKVTTQSLSSTPSFHAGPMPNSTKSSTKDSISPDSIAIPCLSHASSNISPPTAHLPLREIISLNALSPSSEQLPTMPDFSMSPKDLELLLWSSPKQPKTELLAPREHATLSTNWPNWPLMERMCSCWEVPGIDKQKDISVFTLDKRALTLLLALEPRVVNSREPEAEDDSYPI